MCLQRVLSQSCHMFIHILGYNIQILLRVRSIEFILVANQPIPIIRLLKCQTVHVCNAPPRIVSIMIASYHSYPLQEKGRLLVISWLYFNQPYEQVLHCFTIRVWGCLWIKILHVKDGSGRLSEVDRTLALAALACSRNCWTGHHF